MPRKMKNVNIYVDVDLTVVDHLGQLLPQAIEGLLTLREADCKLFLWSNNGAEYCRQIAERYEMTPLFEAFLPKPDIYIDDMPGSVLSPMMCDVNCEPSWQELADRIVRDHVA